MNELIRPSEALPLPAPRVAIAIRPGTLADVAFMDALQRKTTRQVGWMPTKQFEGKVAAGHMLVAEAYEPEALATVHRESGMPVADASGSCRARVRVGYLIGNDQYFKRDDVGIVYQINVVPEYRRHLVAASLLNAQFERSAYGCRLYCCWCAQDIEANRFWESMGFVPLAFRAGSRTKGKDGAARVHIFWQKRICDGDTSTPWWFPSQTTGGAIREDRLVLPIGPGVHWRDVKPLILPGGDGPLAIGNDGEARSAGPSESGAEGDAATPALRKPRKTKTPVAVAAAAAAKKSIVLSGGMRFAAPATATPEATAPVKAGKMPREPRKKQKNDPRLVAAARELRDRYLEHLAGGEGPVPVGKYDATRVIAGGPARSGIGPHLGLLPEYRERGPGIRATPVPLLSAA